MRVKSLMQTWQLREEPLHVTAADAHLVQEKTENWMDVATLPCDVHVPLTE